MVGEKRLLSMAWVYQMVEKKNCELSNFIKMKDRRVIFCVRGCVLKKVYKKKHRFFVLETKEENKYTPRIRTNNKIKIYRLLYCLKFYTFYIILSGHK